jgi:hypothetical protein
MIHLEASHTRWYILCLLDSLTNVITSILCKLSEVNTTALTLLNFIWKDVTSSRKMVICMCTPPPPKHTSCHIKHGKKKIIFTILNKERRKLFLQHFALQWYRHMKERNTSQTFSLFSVPYLNSTYYSYKQLDSQQKILLPLFSIFFFVKIHLNHIKKCYTTN